MPSSPLAVAAHFSMRPSASIAPMAFPMLPTVAHENMTSGGIFILYAIATPIAIPHAPLANFAIVAKKPRKGIWLSVSNIVPMSSEANRPSAIAPIASMK